MAQRARGRSAGPRRPGASIVEMLVAIVILAIGVLGLAATASMVVRHMGSGARLGAAATLAQARFERLSAAACEALLAAPSGEAVARGVREQWRVAAAANGTLELFDSLTYDTPRGPRAVAYRSLRAC